MKINFGSVKEKLSGGKKGKPKKKWLKIVIALVLIAVILISILLWRSAQARQAAAEAETVNTAVVTRQNITSELSRWRRTRFFTKLTIPVWKPS